MSLILPLGSHDAFPIPELLDCSRRRKREGGKGLRELAYVVLEQLEPHKSLTYSFMKKLPEEKVMFTCCDDPGSDDCECALALKVG